MSFPIIEQIAQELTATLNLITVAAGFEQDLHAGRLKQQDTDNIEDWLLAGGCPYSTGHVLVGQVTEDWLEEGAQNTAEWKQSFAITCFAIVSDKAADSPDTQINQMVADIRKKLMLTYSRGGLALDTLLGPATFFRGKGFAGAEIIVIVQYRTKIDDPYTRI
jgi:hypothetical protein